MREKKEKLECKICGNKDYTSDHFSHRHLKKIHDIDLKKYYDVFYKKEDEGYCLNCEKETSFYSFIKGYRKYCSQNCARVSDIKRKQLSDSWIERDLEEVKRKFNKTCLERYGTENYTQTPEFKKKFEQTCLERYGVKHNFLTEDCIDKRWKSLNENKEEINKKRKKSWTEEKIKSVNKTREENNFKKYGVKNVLELDWVVEKLRNKMYEKYGVDNVVSSQYFRKSQEENFQWVPLEFQKEFEEYRKIVMRETKKWKRKLFKEWDGKCYYTKELLLTNKQYEEKYPINGKNTNRMQPTIDHKISVYYGFMNRIDPIIIADITNLCVCSRYINSSKGNLTEEEFLNKLLNER